MVDIGGTFLRCQTRIRAAGVAASPASDWLQIKGDRAGRVPVPGDLTAPGHPEIFVIGDTVTVPACEGKPVPGGAPAAKQQSAYVARVIRASQSGRAAPPDSKYRHPGDLATIGKRSAVIQYGRLRICGFLAWCIRGIAHICFLIGARSRASGAWNWV